MKRIPIILALALICSGPSAHAQTVPSKRDMKTVSDTLAARLKRRDSVDASFRISKAIPAGGRMEIRFTAGLGDHPWHEADQKWFRDELSKEWKKIGGGEVGAIRCGSLPFEELLTPKLTSAGFAVDYRYTDTKSDHRSESGRFIRRVGAKNFAKGLSDRYIALWQSHGRYYSPADSLWGWQRATMFRTVEDMYTQSYVLPYLIPMLENAGAYVMTPRERDIQRHEIVADNDPSFRRSGDESVRTEGRYSENGFWSSAGVGFADSRQTYTLDDNPFRMGTARQARCSGDESDASVRWTPTIPGRGSYAVYISYISMPASSTEAHYTVHHMGGDTEFLVNQKMGGSTWIYLGTFEFDEGDLGYVTLDNRGLPGKVVTADAVRFGGGMGKVERDGMLSGMPSYMEGSLYWMKWAGVDNSIFNEEWENDYKKDYAGRGAWTRMMKEEKGIPFDLSLAFHSDAGVTPDDSIVGTLSIYTLLCDKEREYADGRDRMMARTYADFVQSQVVSDIRDGFEPKWSRRRLWDKSYSECRTTGVPGIILELLSHQNFADMKYGLDPSFKFTVSRAVYKGMLKTLSEFYGCPYEVQPLPVNSFSVSFTEDGTKAHLEWKETPDPVEQTAKAKGYMVYTKVDDGCFDEGICVEDTSADIEIATGHIYSFKVAAFNDGGLSFPSQTLAAGRPESRKAPETVLIVNNFDRISGPDVIEMPGYAGFDSGSDSGVPYINDISYIGEMYCFDRSVEYVDDFNPGFGSSFTDKAGLVVAGNTFDYPYVHGKAFFDLGYAFCSSSREAFTAAPDTTAAILDLICGKQKTTRIGRGAVPDRYQVFPSDLQKAVKAFAAAGGSLFVTGSRIGTDARAHHDSEQFIRETLGIRLINSHGTSGGMIGKFEFADTPNSEIYCVENVDAIGPSDKDGKVILRYPINNSPAAVSFATEQYSAVTIGVPLETVKSESDRKSIVKASLQALQRPRP